MIGFAQHAQSPTQRAECAQSCALATLHYAEANHVVAQMALACAVDPAPSAQEIVSTDHRSRPGCRCWSPAARSDREFTQVLEHSVWDRWWWIGVLVILFCLEWWWRRKLDLV